VNTSLTTLVQQEIDERAPWFHNLHLPGGLQTAPDHPLGDFPATKWNYLMPHVPDDLHGWRVLDIGCNAGFYTFEMARRGADVTAIDVASRYLEQARWAAGEYGLTERITFREMQVYDLAHSDAMYDLVLFMGVFYHLRYPMLGLDIVSQKVRRMMIFQSLTLPGREVVADTDGLPLLERDALREPGWPKMAFIEHSLADDPTNWWIPNHAGIEAMLRAAGMRVKHALKHELYICEPDPERPSCMTTWNQAEFLAATGQNGAHHD
jgi:tRNA (mo5U34)-methyltransferase